MGEDRLREKAKVDSGDKKGENTVGRKFPPEKMDQVAKMCLDTLSPRSNGKKQGCRKVGENVTKFFLAKNVPMLVKFAVTEFLC